MTFGNSLGSDRISSLFASVHGRSTQLVSTMTLGTSASSVEEVAGVVLVDAAVGAEVDDDDLGDLAAVA